MKKIFLIIIALCAAISVSAFCIFSASSFSKGLRGSGKIVTTTIDVPKFDAIDASRAVKVIITDETSDKITIAADDNLIDFVEVKEYRGKLKITIDKSYTSIQNPSVTVTIPVTSGNRIRILEASSAASINSTVVLSAPDFLVDASSAANISVAVKADKCRINASSAAKIKAAVNSDVCEINASSAAKIELTGSAKTADIGLSSASKLAADSFIIETCTIHASSGSKATIYCSLKLDASASSGANINYKGTSSIVTVTPSSGSRISRE